MMDGIATLGLVVSFLCCLVIIAKLIWDYLLDDRDAMIARMCRELKLVNQQLEGSRRDALHLKDENRRLQREAILLHSAVSEKSSLLDGLMNGLKRPRNAKGHFAKKAAGAK